MKSFFRWMLMLCWSISANALKIDRIFDGTSAYCPSDSLRWTNPNQKQYRVRKVEQDIVVELVKCQDGRWVLDPTPLVDESTWREPLNGHEYRVIWHYSEYHIEITNQEGRLIAEYEAPNIDRTGQTLIPISVFEDLPENFYLRLWCYRSLESSGPAKLERGRDNFGTYLFQLERR